MQRFPFPRPSKIAPQKKHFGISIFHTLRKFPKSMEIEKFKVVFLLHKFSKVERGDATYGGDTCPTTWVLSHEIALHSCFLAWKSWKSINFMTKTRMEYNFMSHNSTSRIRDDAESSSKSVKFQSSNFSIWTRFTIDRWRSSTRLSFQFGVVLQFCVRCRLYRNLTVKLEQNSFSVEKHPPLPKSIGTY